MGRLDALYPAKTEWTQICECTMERKESLDSYRKRLGTCFRLHCGIHPGEQAYQDLLDDSLMRGLRSDLQKSVRTTCIVWETEPLVTAERQQGEQKEENKKRRKGEDSETTGCSIDFLPGPDVS
jgi:hypothetical protein